MGKEKKVVICPYCGNPAEWTENKAIYGRNFGKSYMCYYCKPCDAYVGCHKNSRTPLGTMANKELRMWRMRAHKKIDSLWKHGYMKRKEVYAILKTIFGQEIHIAEADVETCRRIVKMDWERIKETK